MDAQADCVLLVGGYDVEAVRGFVAEGLGELQTHGALPGCIAGLYRCAYSLPAKELRA